MKVLVIFVVICTFTHGAHIRNIRSPRPALSLDGRIIGGHGTDIEDLPYQLSLQSGGSHICGASIISANWALTAAHCVDGASESSVSLRAGSNRKGQGGTVHQTAQIIVHPQYDSSNTDYDFALIRVSTPFSLGQPGIQAVPLTDVVPSDGTSCVVSGWGYSTSISGILLNQLQSVNVNIINRASCQEDYADYSVTERMICAGVPLGGKDSCQGDSGGPLVADGVQVGVVSWGVGCALPGYPGVYSNIANQRAWIRENSGV